LTEQQFDKIAKDLLFSKGTIPQKDLQIIYKALKNKGKDSLINEIELAEQSQDINYTIGLIQKVKIALLN